MGPALPLGSNQRCSDESPLRGEENTFDANKDGALSLLEENARLRALVVRLSSIILKSVAEQK